MKKAMTVILGFLLLVTPTTGLMAESMKHHSGHSMAMGQDKKMDMKPAKLGKYKKSKFWTKSKRVMIKAPLVPVTPGIARFEVQLLGKKGNLLTKAKITSARFEMPGMKMDLPKVAVRQTKPGFFQLVFPVPMAGFWKVHMMILSDGQTEQGTLKFVTK